MSFRPLRSFEFRSARALPPDHERFLKAQSEPVIRWKRRLEFPDNVRNFKLLKWCKTTERANFDVESVPLPPIKIKKVEEIVQPEPELKEPEIPENQSVPEAVLETKDNEASIVSVDKKVSPFNKSSIIESASMEATKESITTKNKANSSPEEGEIEDVSMEDKIHNVENKALSPSIEKEVVSISMEEKNQPISTKNNTKSAKESEIETISMEDKIEDTSMEDKINPISTDSKSKRSLVKNKIPFASMEALIEPKSTENKAKSTKCDIETTTSGTKFDSVKEQDKIEKLPLSNSQVSEQIKIASSTSTVNPQKNNFPVLTKISNDSSSIGKNESLKSISTSSLQKSIIEHSLRSSVLSTSTKKDNEDSLINPGLSTDKKPESPVQKDALDEKKTSSSIPKLNSSTSVIDSTYNEGSLPHLNTGTTETSKSSEQKTTDFSPRSKVNDISVPVVQIQPEKFHSNLPRLEKSDKASETTNVSDEKTSSESISTKEKSSLSSTSAQQTQVQHSKIAQGSDPSSFKLTPEVQNKTGSLDKASNIDPISTSMYKNSITELSDTSKIPEAKSNSNNTITTPVKNSSNNLSTSSLDISSNDPKIKEPKPYSVKTFPITSSSHSQLNTEADKHLPSQHVGEKLIDSSVMESGAHDNMDKLEVSGLKNSQQGSSVLQKKVADNEVSKDSPESTQPNDRLIPYGSSSDSG